MRETMVYDATAGEVVVKSEMTRRQAERARAAGETCKRFDLPRRVERGSWVFDRRTGELVSRAEYLAARSEELRHARNADMPTPMLIRDDIGAGVNGLWHPATCARSDSKSQFRHMTKGAGCVETDGGTSDYVPPPLPPVAETIRQACEMNGTPL
jgi:hypothetical protein